jgi:hypothetical protein
VAQDVIRPALESAAEAIAARADLAKVATTPPALAATMLATVAVEAAAPLLLETRFPEMLRLHAKSLAQHQERADRSEAEIERLRGQALGQSQALSRRKRLTDELAGALRQACEAAQRGDLPDPERLESWRAVLERAPLNGG